MNPEHWEIIKVKDNPYRDQLESLLKKVRPRLSRTHNQEILRLAQEPTQVEQRLMAMEHFSYLAAAGLISMTLGAGSASAIDIRSWDKKISNVEKRFIVLSALNSEAVLDKETQVV